MRTRATITPVTLPSSNIIQQEYNSVNGVTTTTTVYSQAAYPYNAMNNSIEDEKPLKLRSGNCLHTKVGISLLDSPFVFKTRNSANTLRNTWDVSGAWLARKYAVPQLGNLPDAVVLPLDWESWSYDAIQKMRPSLGDGMLLPNFVKELAETGKQYKERWQQRKRRYIDPSANRSWPKNLARFIGRLWSRPANYIARAVKKAAEIHLFYRFVVVPTLQDVRTLAKLLESYESRMSELIRGANKIQRGHYARRLDVVTLPADVQLGSTTFDFECAQFMFRKSFWQERPSYHASMLYSYDASQLQYLSGQLRLLLHTLGVDRVASVVWEAIPFSFVVDWFVNVGEQLSSMEDQLLDPLPIVIHDFCHSVKYVYRTNIEFNFWEQQAYPESRKLLIPALAHREVSYYQRRRDTPCLWDPLKVRTPSLDQAGLGLSLIIVRMDGIAPGRKP